MLLFMEWNSSPSQGTVHAFFSLHQLQTNSLPSQSLVQCVPKIKWLKHEAHYPRSKLCDTSPLSFHGMVLMHFTFFIVTADEIYKRNE